MEGISSADQAHPKRVYKDFIIRNFHDLCVQSNTLLLADVKLLKYVFKYMSLILLIFYFALGLAQEVALQKIKVKLDLLSDVDMSLIAEKGIRGGICHAFIDM